MTRSAGCSPEAFDVAYMIPGQEAPRWSVFDDAPDLGRRCRPSVRGWCVWRRRGRARVVRWLQELGWRRSTWSTRRSTSCKDKPKSDARGCEGMLRLQLLVGCRSAIWRATGAEARALSRGDSCCGKLSTGSATTAGAAQPAGWTWRRDLCGRRRRRNSPPWSLNCRR